MIIRYQPQGVCSRQMTVEVEDGVIRAAEVVGGCSGNAQGLSRLLAGMPVEEAIRRLDGIRCGDKPTSCPDQMAQALRQTLDPGVTTDKEEEKSFIRRIWKKR